MTTKVEMNHEHADQALFIFKGICEALDLDWCLYAGTGTGNTCLETTT